MRAVLVFCKADPSSGRASVVGRPGALYFHMLLLISTVAHQAPRLYQAVALWMFSSAFAICFVLLLMYDRPFHTGGLSVGPVGIETERVE